MKENSKLRKGELYRALKTAILTLRRHPGSDLDEVQLSEEFSLSRTPLREVLRQLAGEGYVELRENRGARISEMSHTSLRDFFLAAPMVYGAILRLSCTKCADLDKSHDLKSCSKRLFKKALRSGSGD